MTADCHLCRRLDRLFVDPDGVTWRCLRCAHRRWLREVER